MNIFLAILNGILTGALGLFAVGFLGAACAKWYHVSGMEGQAGYFVIAIAILGGIVGCVIGLVTTWALTHTGGGFLKSWGYAGGITLGLTGLATLICWALADIPPKLEGRAMMLEIEIKLPKREDFTPSTTKDDSHLWLGSIVNHRQRSSWHGEFDQSKAEQVEGRWVIPAKVYLYTTRGLRGLTIQLQGQSRDGFIIPLPRRPGKEFEQWSDWGPRGISKTEPWPDTKISYRFRVQQIIPPPPGPTPEEEEAQAFAALSPQAPLEQWIPFAKYDAPEERTTEVMKVVEPRQAELATLIRSTNSTMREQALSVVPKLVKFAPEIIEAVLAEGKEISAGVKRFNEMNEKDEKFWDVQIQLRSRFNYWKQAWWAIQQRMGLDGKPPVQEIFDLAQVRAKATSMDEIVLNARVILEALTPAAATTP